MKIVRPLGKVKESPDGMLEKAVSAVREAFNKSEESAIMDKQSRFRPVAASLDPPSGLDASYCGVRILKLRNGSSRLGYYDPEVGSWVLALNRRKVVPMEIWGVYAGTLIEGGALSSE